MADVPAAGLLPRLQTRHDIGEHEAMVAALHELREAESEMAADPKFAPTDPRVAPADPRRARLVEQIAAINPSATPVYLDGFDAAALALYLRHLQSAAGPRGPAARWVRPGDTRAIVRWRPPEERFSR